MKNSNQTPATKDMKRVNIEADLAATLIEIKEAKGLSSQSEALSFLVSLWTKERENLLNVGDKNDPTKSAASKLDLFFDALVAWNKAQSVKVHFGTQATIAAITGVNPSRTVKPYFESNDIAARFPGIAEPATKEAKEANAENIKKAILAAGLGELFPKAKA